MTPSSLTKLARRAAADLRHANAMTAAATTEKARKRHERRAANARKALSALDFDARRLGMAEA